MKKITATEILGCTLILLSICAICVLMIKNVARQPYTDWIGCDTGNPVLVTYYPEEIVGIDGNEISVVHDGTLYTTYTSKTCSIGEVVWAGYYDNQLIDLRR